MKMPNKPKGTELCRWGKNDKWFLVKKDGQTMQFADILTADGKQVKQSFVKLVMFAKSMDKTAKTCRDHALTAEKLGIPYEGELQIVFTDKNAPKVFNKEKAIAFILQHGGNIADFENKGTPSRVMSIV